MNKQSIFKKGSITYYYSSIFFPASVRSDVFSLYAYVRTVDDYVDADIPDVVSLKSTWKQTNDAWKGKKTGNIIVDDFILVVKKYKFEWSWVTSFWSAMKADLTKKNYKTQKELNTYMYGSAEVIGLMMARILGLPKKAEKYAQLQGKAMQLINFIRDVEEDRSLHRWYLPEIERKKFGIRTGKERGWNEFIRYQITKYIEIQREAEKGYRYIPRRLLIPIKTAAQMYRWTAENIQENPQVVWQKKIKPRPSRVIATVIKNILQP